MYGSTPNRAAALLRGAERFFTRRRLPVVDLLLSVRVRASPCPPVLSGAGAKAAPPAWGSL
ncbi:hypothetical protein GCM10018781_58250 [Kitasatospora indigofera]|uniref:Uncharacterized protein n=1 Tax=Kitasatospora indigofera TaxID=67307 RepID=A0A919L0N1_9ACTN|nr:hypothetical protein GCM10018781_58250 [Kitasatospora indigofera]